MKNIKHVLPVLAVTATLAALAGCGAVADALKTAVAEHWEAVGTPNISVTSGAVKHNSISIYNGVPYVATIDQATNSTGIAKVYYFDATWQQLGPTLSVGTNDKHTTIGVRSVTHPTNIYLTYNDSTNSAKAICKKFNGTAWVQQGSAISDGSAFYIAQVLNASNYPVVVFQDAGLSSRGRAFEYNGTTWTELDSTNHITSNGAKSLNIAMGASDRPVVVLRGGTGNPQVYVRKYTGSTWQDLIVPTECVAEAEEVNAIACDATVSKNPWIAYVDDNDQSIKVYAYNGSAWVNKGTLDAGRYPTLAIATDGTVYISYLRNSDSKTVVKKWSSGTTWVNVVSDGISTGQSDYPFMTLDSSNNPWVIFGNGSANKAVVLKYVPAQ